jgi:NADPH-dependent glutamate synthase beta subunit-like oxidoreductase/Pyruvate/2-oxoacid:ferredoxin oxidoreductase delta subunit
MLPQKKVVKVVKKVTKSAGASAATGAEISPLRPRFQPKQPPCSHNCPSATDIRGWLTTIAQGEAYGRTLEQSLEQAFYMIAENNPLPAVCGRVCPHPCETACNRNSVDKPVSINAMERFIGDFALDRKLKLKMLTDTRQEERVAVIGSGPAGLSCAYQLARRGYPVTVCEGFPKAGGMLRYGIPRYRLPSEVLDAEIERIRELGVEIHTNTMVGREQSYEALRQEHRAVFVGIGAHRGLRLGVPGEDAPNVMSGVELLHRVNEGQRPDLGVHVVVIGGGDTAVDAARVARRLGAQATILYRRTRNEMPAIAAEIDGAEQEGVKIELLAAPLEINCRDGLAVGMRVQRMQLGEPDKSGRPRPVPIPGDEYTIECSAVIPAISQEPDFVGLAHLKAGPKDWIKIDARGRTSEDGTYAGGDVVALALATTAIGQGRLAAETIDAYLRGSELPIVQDLPLVKPERMKLSYYKAAERHDISYLPAEQRFTDADREIAVGLTLAQATDEAKRCLSCGMCFDCDTCWMYCQNSGFERLPKGQHFRIKMELCNGCKKCGEECPCGYIDLV